MQNFWRFYLFYQKKVFLYAKHVPGRLKITSPRLMVNLPCPPGRARTCDQMLKRHLLYQLSYGRLPFYGNIRRFRFQSRYGQIGPEENLLHPADAAVFTVEFDRDCQHAKHQRIPKPYGVWVAQHLALHPRHPGKNKREHPEAPERLPAPAFEVFFIHTKILPTNAPSIPRLAQQGKQRNAGRNRDIERLFTAVHRDF